MRDKITIPPRLRPPLSQGLVAVARARAPSCARAVASLTFRVNVRASIRTRATILRPHSPEALFRLCNPYARASATHRRLLASNCSIAKSLANDRLFTACKTTAALIRTYRRSRFAFYLAIFLVKCHYTHMPIRILDGTRTWCERQPIPKPIYVTICCNYQCTRTIISTDSVSSRFTTAFSMTNGQPNSNLCPGEVRLYSTFYSRAIFARFPVRFKATRFYSRYDFIRFSSGSTVHNIIARY